MKLVNLLLLGGATCCGALLYYIFRKSKETKDPSKKVLQCNRIYESLNNHTEDIEKKCIQGIFTLTDVVGWFKNIANLDQNVDTPFIAKATEFKELLCWVSTKKYALFMGVYNDSLDSLTHAIIIETDELDEKIKEILGNEPLVVLN